MKTVYCLYITIPDNLWTRYAYLVPNKINFDYDVRGETHTGLYAWTTSKKALKKFLSYRNTSSYILEKYKYTHKRKSMLNEMYNDDKIGKYIIMKYMNNEDFEKFGNDRDNFKHSEIGKDNDKFISIHLTFLEYLNITTDLEQNLNLYGTFPLLDYNFFERKFLDLLDSIGYVFKYDTEIRSGAEDGLDNISTYNAGFGKTLFGYDLPEFYYSEYMFLFYLYEYPIYGYTLY